MRDCAGDYGRGRGDPGATGVGTMSDGLGGVPGDVGTRYGHGRGVLGFLLEFQQVVFKLLVESSRGRQLRSGRVKSLLEGTELL